MKIRKKKIKEDKVQIGFYLSNDLYRQVNACYFINKGELYNQAIRYYFSYHEKSFNAISEDFDFIAKILGIPPKEVFKALKTGKLIGRLLSVRKGITGKKGVLFFRGQSLILPGNTKSFEFLGLLVQFLKTYKQQYDLD